MTTLRIEEGYQLSLPTELQAMAPIGAQFQVTVDDVGRIILTPEKQVRAILLETFGLWSDRNDIPTDGLTYMDNVRQGRRLDQPGIDFDETD